MASILAAIVKIQAQCVPQLFGSALPAACTRLMRCAGSQMHIGRHFTANGAKAPTSSGYIEREIFTANGAKAPTSSGYIEHEISTTNGAEAPTSSGYIEVREYTIQPGGFSNYLKLTADYMDVRKELLPCLGMFTCDLGGVMHRLIHMYHYKDFDHRDMVRAAASRDPRWQRYIIDSRKYLANQTSKILREEDPVYEMLELAPTSEYRSPPRDVSKVEHVVYEMRTYQLPHGYESMNQLVEALDKSLPDKVPDYAPAEKGHLVLFGHTEVGPYNQVTELWRWHTAQAALRAREESWAMPTLFHHTVAATTGISDFNYEFLHPTAFSNWQ